eukprot:UN03647
MILKIPSKEVVKTDFCRDVYRKLRLISAKLFLKYSTAIFV